MEKFKAAGLRRPAGSIGEFEPFLIEVRAADIDAAWIAAYADSNFEIQVRAVVPVTNVKQQVDDLASAYWAERWKPGGTIELDGGGIEHSPEAKRVWDAMGPVTKAAAAANEVTLVRCGVPEKVAKVTASHEDLTLEAECLRWTGHSPVGGYELDRFLSPPLRDVEEWSNGFRVVWTDDERLIVTYCEGDLSGQLFFSPTAFANHWAHAKDFYTDH